MRVEVTTALCGEEAVRVARQKHFHMITMDQTLSPGYCKSVLEAQGSLRCERLAQGGASDDALGSFDMPAVLTIDADRLQTAKRRTEFFEDELVHHLVRLPPGSSSGAYASFSSYRFLAWGITLFVKLTRLFQLCASGWQALLCLLFSGSLVCRCLGPRRRRQHGRPRGDAHYS